jgi:hypothetical protein
VTYYHYENIKKIIRIDKQRGLTFKGLIAIKLMIIGKVRV